MQFLLSLLIEHPYPWDSGPPGFPPPKVFVTQNPQSLKEEIEVLVHLSQKYFSYKSSMTLLQKLSNSSNQ